MEHKRVSTRKGCTSVTCMAMMVILCMGLMQTVQAIDGKDRKGQKSCKLKVEEAELFDILTVEGSDAGRGRDKLKGKSMLTVLLNKQNKIAYVLDKNVDVDDGNEGSQGDEEESDVIDSESGAAGGSSFTLSSAQEEAVQEAIEDSVDDGDEYQIFAFKTPLTNVEVLETQLNTYVELLGARDAITGISPYTSSPCLQKMYAQGKVSLMNDSEVSGEYNASQPVQFVGYTVGNVTNDTVQFAVSAELKDGSMLQASEWIKYFAPFFNKECAANDIFDKVKERYNCHKQKVADTYSTSSSKPVVAVAFKNSGYDCDGCPYQTGPYFGINDASYYKDYIEAAGGVPLLSTQLTATLGSPDPLKGGFVLNTTDELQEALSNADILIDTSDIANATLDDVLNAYNLSSSDEDFNFIKNKAIWRVDRRLSSLPDHGSDWFESRYPEADVLLEDLIYAVHPNYSSLMLNPQHELTWLRNMFTSPEQVFLNASMCEDENAPSKLISDDCSLFKS